MDLVHSKFLLFSETLWFEASTNPQFLGPSEKSLRLGGSDHPSNAGKEVERGACQSDLHKIIRGGPVQNGVCV